MSRGTPVIAARNSSLPEVLGDAPVWVDGFDVEEWAAAVRGVLAEPARADRLRGGIGAGGQIHVGRNRAPDVGGLSPTGLEHFCQFCSRFVYYIGRGRHQATHPQRDNGPPTARQNGEEGRRLSWGRNHKVLQIVHNQLYLNRLRYNLRL